MQLYGRGARDWPAALGFSAGGVADGLCLGFGWDAHAPHGASYAREACNGFAAVYNRAAQAGARLAELCRWIAERRPDLKIDLFAHSLGARVALSAMGTPGVAPTLGRVLLLGAAEDAETARGMLPACAWARGPQIFHMAARHNDAFDALFEAAAPRIRGRRPQALGREGLRDRRADWIDLQLDSPAFAAFANARGIPLAVRAPRVCHWGFYLRPGAMDLHRAILRDREAWSIPTLRAEGVPEGLAPRWSRLAPRLALRRPTAPHMPVTDEAAA